MKVVSEIDFIRRLQQSVALGGMMAATAATNWNVYHTYTPRLEDRLLRDIQKPLVELTVPKANEVKVWSHPEGEVL